MAAAPEPLRTLLLEDSPTDAELAVFELEDAGFEVVSERVSTRDEFLDALAAFRPDVVLADYSLPGFDGGEALTLATERFPEVPVIIVTGALGDERAIGLIKAGARDYVLKTHLARLGPAVQRALAEVREVRARRQAEHALTASELRYRRLFEAARDGIIIVDADNGQILDVNPFLIVLLGYSRGEYVGKKLWETAPFRNQPAVHEAFAALQKLEYMRCEDVQLSARSGARVEIECTSNVCVIDTQRVIQWNFRDVTEIRRAAEAAAVEREKLLASLEQRVEQRTAQLRELAFELTKAEEHERQAIARDLHDGLGQTLAIAKIKLDGLGPDTAPADLLKALASAEKLIDQSNRSVRSLAAQLSPGVLYDLGLVPALDWLVEQEFREHGLRCEIVADDHPKPLDQAVRAILFRAARELLMNVVKHAEVKVSEVRVEISVTVLPSAESPGLLRIVVRDNGRGFDPKAVKRTTGSGFGLISVRERLNYIGGSVHIDSEPGRGTAVTLTAPLQQLPA